MFALQKTVGMKQRQVTVAMAITASIFTGFAQEKELFEPSGKPIFRIFSNYHSSFSEGETFNAFEITRAYLGYKYHFNQNWNGRLIFDVGDPEDGGKHEMSAYVKNASITYKKNGLAVNFGLISTTSFKTQESFWGYRYLLKSFQDEYKFGSSADLGVSASYNFNNVISTDLIIVNGEGYKKVEKDSIFSVGAGLTIKPFKGLQFRGYYGTSTKEEGELKRENTTALFVGYGLGNFSFGTEYNIQTNHKMVDGNDWAGYSLYTTYNIKSSGIFVRFDNLTPKDGLNVAHEEKLFVIGAEFNPVKGVKIAPNYRHHSTEANGTENTEYFYLNCEIKF